MNMEPGGTRKVDTALASWSIPMTCNAMMKMQKDQSALLPGDSFTTHPVVDDQLTMASVVVKPCSIKGKASLTKIFIVLKNNQSPAQSRISIFMFNICLKPHFTESG